MFLSVIILVFPFPLLCNHGQFWNDRKDEKSTNIQLIVDTIK